MAFSPDLNHMIPMWYVKEDVVIDHGIRKKGDSIKVMFMGTFKTYGGTEIKGTESRNSGIYEILDTAQIVTWFDPNITKECFIRLEDGREYEIISVPENLNMMNQFMMFKVKRKLNG